MTLPMQVGLLKSDHGLRRQVIVESLLKDIVHGRLVPGQHLVAQALAERFGVSHTPIREALMALVGSGVVDLLPNRGAVVRRLTTVEVREIYQVRCALECEAVRTACGRIDPEELLAVREALRGLIGRNPSDRDGSIEAGGRRIRLRGNRLGRGPAPGFAPRPDMALHGADGTPAVARQQGLDDLEVLPGFLGEPTVIVTGLDVLPGSVSKGTKENLQAVDFLDQE